ncbi:unnamed protein product [Microthlaspi erraticum]|uniref:RNase H type-1 domain-containing protein n=1 Tax=Microthlaspi erraticum TaxID=1685480 RepID=A0A6D2HC61_9BRAS|nr:unnamed protein product [Microthlaspi erraticum]
MGDGQKILFWTDKWLMGNVLSTVTPTEIPEDILGLTAGELWIDGVGWDLTKIAPYVSANTQLELSAVVVVDRVTGRTDKMAWGETSDGRFTVSSAYRFLSRDLFSRPDMSKLFRSIWRVVAPERVRVFFWLLGNNRIMTNQERFHRHIGDTELCQICKADIESTLHILRDCSAMSGIWERVVPREKHQVFFNMSLLEWLFVNLVDSSMTEFGPWSTLFAVAVKCKEDGEGAVGREERLISWLPPLIGWTKLNTDGASHGNPGLATAGGALRDGEGKWCGGFALNIGRCTAPMAELWGLYYGLCIAWEKGFTRLEVEVDSSLVVVNMCIGRLIVLQMDWQTMHFP